MKLIVGFRAIALIQIFMSCCFIFGPEIASYGILYRSVNFFGAGVLIIGTIFAYFKAQRWNMWLLAFAMLVLTVFNAVVFIIEGSFFTTGFPLIGYNTTFIVACLHFLGKGLS